MKMSKIGNQTNSQDPQAVCSRIFVGNLNTFQCSKTDVERMFQRYGRLAGISMHKGFAFIQFTNPFDARSACLGEDGRTILGQTLDVNLVTEPKPHQIGRKRPNLGKTGNDWDYFYDSYYASAFPALRIPGHSVPSKRARLLLNNATRSGLSASTVSAQMSRKSSPSKMMQSQSQPTQQNHSDDHPISVSQLKTYSNPDILICGNCRELFSELEELLQHKKNYCKLRFTCKCDSVALAGINEDKNGSEDKISLLCVQCKDSFDSAWDLIVHVQAAHMVNVYELGTAKEKNSQIKTHMTEDNGHDENIFLSEQMNRIDKLPNLSQDIQTTSIGKENNQSQMLLNKGNCLMLSDQSIVYATPIKNGSA